MDFSNLTLPFFLEPLRLIPYYNARLADLLERVRAAYRQWIDRGRNQLFGPLEQIIVGCVAVALGRLQSPIGEMLNKKALQTGPSQAASPQQLDFHFPPMYPPQPQPLTLPGWTRQPHINPGHSQPSNEEQSSTSEAFWQPYASAVIIVLLLANIALLLLPEDLKHSLRKPYLLLPWALNKLKPTGQLPQDQARHAPTPQDARDGREPIIHAEPERSSGSAETSMPERTPRTEKGATKAETLQLKEPEARQTPALRTNKPIPEPRCLNEKAARRPDQPIESSAIPTEVASAAKNINAANVVSKGSASPSTGDDEMEKASKSRAMPDLASLTPEEKEKLKMAMLKKRRDKEKRLAQEATAEDPGAAGTSKSSTDVQSADGAPKESRTRSGDGATKQVDRKDLTPEERQKMKLALRAREAMVQAATAPSSQPVVTEAVPLASLPRSATAQRPSSTHNDDSAIKLTQSEKSRLVRAAELKKEHDHARPPGGDETAKRSSITSTGSTRSLTQSERAQLAKAKEKLAAAQKTQSDVAATKPTKPPPAPEPTTDPLDSSATSDTDASDSGVATDDPLMAGDYRPLKSALKKSRKKPRQHKNIQHNYFMTIRGWRPALVPFPHGLHPKPHKPRHTLWWDNIPKDADHIMAPPPVPKLPEGDVTEGETKPADQSEPAETKSKEAPAKKSTSEPDPAPPRRTDRDASASRSKEAGTTSTAAPRERPSTDTPDKQVKPARSTDADEAKLRERELRKQLEKKKLSEAAAQAVVDGSEKPPTKLVPAAEQSVKPASERSTRSTATAPEKESSSKTYSHDAAKLREVAKIKEAEKLKELEKRRQAEKLKELEKAKAAEAAKQKPESKPSSAERSASGVPPVTARPAPITTPPGMDSQLLRAQYATQALLCVLLYQIHDQLAMILLAFFMYQYMIDRQKLADAQKATTALSVAQVPPQASSGQPAERVSRGGEAPIAVQHNVTPVVEGASKRSAPAQPDEKASREDKPRETTRSSGAREESSKAVDKPVQETKSREVKPEKAREKPAAPESRIAADDLTPSRAGPTSKSRPAAGPLATGDAPPRVEEKPVPRDTEMLSKPKIAGQKLSPTRDPGEIAARASHSDEVSRSVPLEEATTKERPAEEEKADPRGQLAQKTDPRRARVEDEEDGGRPMTTPVPDISAACPQKSETTHLTEDAASTDPTRHPALPDGAIPIQKVAPSNDTGDGERGSAHPAPASKKEMTPEMLEAYKRAKIAKSKEMEAQKSKTSGPGSAPETTEEIKASSRSIDDRARKEMTPETIEAYKRAKMAKIKELEAQNSKASGTASAPGMTEGTRTTARSTEDRAGNEMTPEMAEAYRLAKAKAKAKAAEQAGKSQNDSHATPAPEKRTRMETSKEPVTRVSGEKKKEMTPEILEAYKTAKEAKLRQAAGPSGNPPSVKKPDDAPSTAAPVEKEGRVDEASNPAASAADAPLLSQESSSRIAKSEITPEMVAAYKRAKEARSKRKEDKQIEPAHVNAEPGSTDVAQAIQPSNHPEATKQHGRRLDPPRELVDIGDARPKATAAPADAVSASGAVLSTVQPVADCPAGRPSPEPDKPGHTAHPRAVETIKPSKSRDKAPAQQPASTAKDPTVKPSGKLEKPAAASTTGNPEASSKSDQPEATSKRLRTTSGRDLTPDMLAAYERAKREKRHRERQKLELEALKEERRQKLKAREPRPAASDGQSDRPLERKVSDEPALTPPREPVQDPPPGKHLSGDKDVSEAPESSTSTERAGKTLPRTTENKAKGLVVSVEDGEGPTVESIQEKDIPPKQRVVVQRAVLSDKRSTHDAESSTAESKPTDSPGIVIGPERPDKRKELKRLGRAKVANRAGSKAPPEDVVETPVAPTSEIAVQEVSEYRQPDHTDPVAHIALTQEVLQPSPTTDQSKEATPTKLSRGDERSIKDEALAGVKVKLSPTIQAKPAVASGKSEVKVGETQSQIGGEVAGNSSMASPRHKQDDPETKAKRLSLERKLRLRKALRTPLRITKKPLAPGTPVSEPVRGDWPSVEPDELYALMQALEASCELDQGADANEAGSIADAPMQTAIAEEDSAVLHGTDKNLPHQSAPSEQPGKDSEVNRTPQAGGMATKVLHEARLKADPLERKVSVKGKEKMTPEMLEQYEEAKRRQLRQAKSDHSASATPGRPPKSARRRLVDSDPKLSDTGSQEKQVPGPPPAENPQRPSRSDSSKRRKADMSAEDLKAYEEAKCRAMEKRPRQEAEAAGAKTRTQREVRPKIRMEDLNPEMVERMQREKEKRRLERARAKKEAMGQGSSGLSTREKEALSAPASPVTTD